MKECECCKHIREQQELTAVLSRLLKNAADCNYNHNKLRSEYLETLSDHGTALIFHIFYPTQ